MGYGNYQLLPFLFDHKLKCTSSAPLEQSIVLNISPLVSLMVDQVSSLQNHHVAAGILSGLNHLLYQEVIHPSKAWRQG